MSQETGWLKHLFCIMCLSLGRGEELLCVKLEERNTQHHQLKTGCKANRKRYQVFELTLALFSGNQAVLDSFYISSKWIFQAHMCNCHKMTIISPLKSSELLQTNEECSLKICTKTSYHNDTLYLNYLAANTRLSNHLETKPRHK